ncbi:unnamed protein product [Brugia timori]|uniref:Uncharacterized protein n=1 Tax=Brugia timori TaxID=42155 RepID=A0A3P7W2K6_9BILA|nr:unnamed protein product [Brugia timori]
MMEMKTSTIYFFLKLLLPFFFTSVSNPIIQVL